MSDFTVERYGRVVINEFAVTVSDWHVKGQDADIGTLRDYALQWAKDRLDDPPMLGLIDNIQGDLTPFQPAEICPTCHRVIEVQPRGGDHPSPGDHDPAYHVAKAYGSAEPQS